MTIDEAIKFCDEKAWDIKLKTEPQTFLDIAEWLELLKWYQQGMEDIPSESGVLPKDVYRAGYIKAIDDFVKECEAEYDNDGCPSVSDYLDYKLSLREIFEIAEQLKAGDVDG